MTAKASVPTRSPAPSWRVALTFDDGPSEWTPDVLEALAEAGAKATFFVIAANVRQRPDTLRLIVDAGHEIGNHTFTHPRVTTLTDGQVYEELAETQDMIQAETGVLPTFWRAPHFDVDDAKHQVAASLNLTHAGRTIDPSDWQAGPAERIAAAVIDQLADGAIVDLHDGIPPGGGLGTASRADTVAAVRLILAGAPAGTEFVTVTSLLAGDA